MLRILIIACIALPWFLRAQEIPYPVVLDFQEAAESAAHVDGVVCRLRMLHSNPADTRPFKINVVSPEGTFPVDVSPDGAFKLPVLTEQNRGQAKVVHNLERGALSISFAFQASSVFGGDGKSERMILAVCSEIAKELRKLDRMWAILGQAQPELKDLRLAIVGLSVPRSKPMPGHVVLKKDGNPVKTVDLSETGPVKLMFDDYDPKVHSLSWDTGKEQETPPVEFIFASGSEAEGVRNAIYIRQPMGNSRL